MHHDGDVTNNTAKYPTRPTAYAVCGTYGGSSTGGSGWVDVPLTDTADFDKTCEYRFKTDTPTNHTDDPYMGSAPYHYVNAVDTTRLTWFILPGAYHHINSDSKTVYRVNGTANADATISKLEKRCGGGSSGPSF